jgi:hypothetical protein
MRWWVIFLVAVNTTIYHNKMPSSNDGTHPSPLVISHDQIRVSFPLMRVDGSFQLHIRPGVYSRLHRNK